MPTKRDSEHSSKAVFDSAAAAGADEQPVVPDSGALQQRDAALLASRVRLLYDQSRSSYAGSFMAALILVATLWRATPAFQLLTWVTVFAAVIAVRYRMTYRFLRRSSADLDTRPWLYRFIAGNLAAGGMWGIAAIILPPADSPLYIGFTLLWIGGLSAATVATYSAVFVAFLSFAVPAMAPFVIYSLVRGEETHLVIAAMLALFFVFILLSARRMQAAVINSLELQFENVELKTSINDRERGERQFRALLESAPDAMVITNSLGEIVLVNAQTEKLFRYARAELLGQKVEMLLPKRFRAGHRYQRGCYFENPHARPMGEGRELFGLRKDRSEFPVEIILSPLETAEGVLVSSAIRDVTEAHRMKRELAHQAAHDALTGLVNRREFEQRLIRVLKTAAAQKTDNALCYLDLDQFKVINDTCGHAAGDDLLRQAAVALQRQIRRRDTLARLGGDEFGILLEHCSMDQALRVGNMLLEAIREFRFICDDKSFTIGVSIGLVPITEFSESATAVLRAADSACYRAKEQGRHRIHVYREDDAGLTKRHGEMQWVVQIPRALEEGRFILDFQPIVPMGHLDSHDPLQEQPQEKYYELLLRMLDEEGRIVMPGAFLPAAERYNLIAGIDRWVIASALSWLDAHPAHLQSLGLCFINLSGQSVGDEAFLGFVIQQLEKTRVPPGKICFEITETAAISNLLDASRFIRTLKAKGCRFALDDFGSGLSSFAYLKNLPVDFLKIDGAFVRDIVDDPIDLAMVNSINEIGQVMGKQTIAEFVESRAILEKLREIGIDYAQGYGIVPPRHIDDMG